MKVALTTLAAIGATCLIALMFTTAAKPGSPIGGASSQICDSDGHCVTHTTVECKPRAFAWSLQCWNPREGRAFARHLIRHGASPKLFAQRHPQLAATFTQPWPPVKPRTDWAALERDFHKALRHAGQRFGVSYDWLHDCAHSEGGHGPAFVWGSSGDYGPFQFLAGTFEFMSRSAFQTRGRPPLEYRRRDSVVGQTWTAAWAFSRGLSYHWYGAGC